MVHYDLDGEVYEPSEEQKEEKKKSVNPFDFVTAINTSKVDLMEDDEWMEKQYNPFLTNKALSFFQDTVLYANEMNRYYNLDKKMQFHFYLYGVKKGKRFSGKWPKAEDSETIALVKATHKYSTKKATEVAKLLTPEDIERLKRQQFTGGTKNGS